MKSSMIKASMMPASVTLLLLLSTLPVAAHDVAQAPQQVPPTAEQEKATGATEGEQAERDRRLSVDAIRGYSAERREEAMANARRAAAELDEQMEQLQARMDAGWSRMSEASRARSRQAMADLRERRNAMAEWYGGLRHGSAEAWGEVRSGFVKSYHELADALRSARASFDQDEGAAAEKSDEDAEASPPDAGTR